MTLALRLRQHDSHNSLALARGRLAKRGVDEVPGHLPGREGAGPREVALEVRPAWPPAARRGVMSPKAAVIHVGDVLQHLGRQIAARALADGVQVAQDEGLEDFEMRAGVETVGSAPVDAEDGNFPGFYVPVRGLQAHHLEMESRLEADQLSKPWVQGQHALVPRLPRAGSPQLLQALVRVHGQQAAGLRRLAEDKGDA
eukprot:CAMPEP_0170320030 /NCGR_PEP_ID=MMETSP0116_2-20130129/60734_1 /TAXON_ID=400756 /ORGANISM="Durinskia baltica, Strain CSIRO CS-38" /LENGTH=198 /DNA_ID=CAMNT_0010572771 /DNA_START=78 /DNA_END=670 /DNA_ORIENTATION=+